MDKVRAFFVLCSLVFASLAFAEKSNTTKIDFSNVESIVGHELSIAQRLEPTELIDFYSERYTELPIWDGDRLASKEFWDDFIENLQEEDEVFFVRSSDTSWRGLTGWEGFVVIREGELVEGFTTRIN